MRKIAFIFVSLLLPMMALAQSQKDTIVTVPIINAADEEEEIFTVVEEEPTFPGGEYAILMFLNKNIVYPEALKKKKIEGTVYVRFVVEKDGRLTHVAIAREIGGGSGEEAVRVVKLMPNWNPGKQRGKPVRTSFTIPIAFRLR